ncbi:HdeD family acid-resistance protein [Streptomyces sp. NPDC001480]|uniref:HdeD family acid-resistance protein n=1 Tax=Streptomyces sp. NPDC001480 TaxID=3364577 RepID=UPI0036BE3B68
MLALAWVFGAYALVDGAMLLGATWRHRHERRPAATCAGAGALGVVAGLITALWPGLTGLTLVVMAGGWAIVTGCLELWVARRMRHQLRHTRWWRPSAVVSVAAGVLL